MVGRVVVGLWLAILAVVPAAAQDYKRGMEAYRQGNYLTAFRNWRPLAERGHAPSQSSLGFLYNYGHGVERNYRKALKWYHKAADQGFAPAQYHLGFLYTKGLGVAQDYVKAHMWFELGAIGGLSYSDKNRAIVARRMTPEQIAEARELARRWRVKAEARLRAGAAKKRAAKKKAASAKAAAGKSAKKKAAKKKAAEKKPAAQPAARPKAVEDPTKPKPQAGAKPAGPVSPVQLAVNTAEAGHGAKNPSLRKASATVPAAKTSKVPLLEASTAAAPAKAEPNAAPNPETVARRSDAPAETRKSRTGSGPVLLQLGASKSEARALKAIARIAKKHAAILGEVKIRAVRKDLGTRGVYYRLRAGPIADGDAGRALCRKLSARGQSCLLLKP